MTMEWSNEAVMEFLDLYESESVIWDPRNEQHRERSQVYDAWRRIQSSFSMKCSLNELKTKKNNLMATYRKLTMKVKKSEMIAGSAYEVYKPEWFAFDKMASFLHAVYTPKTNKDNENPEGEVTGVGGESTDIETNLPKIEIIEDSSSSIAELIDEPPAVATFEHTEHDCIATGSAPLNLGGPPIGKKRKADKVAPDDAYHPLKQPATKPRTEKDDCYLFCELLCLKLRALDEDTREVAMHEINNLMFNLKRSKNSQGPHCSFQQPYYYHRDLQETVAEHSCPSPLYGSPGASSASQPSPDLISSSPCTLVYQEPDQSGTSRPFADPLEFPERHSPH